MFIMKRNCGIVYNVDKMRELHVGIDFDSEGENDMYRIACTFDDGTSCNIVEYDNIAEAKDKLELIMAAYAHGDKLLRI